MKNKKIAFIHIPKTGGRSLDSLIWNTYKNKNDSFLYSFFGRDKSNGANQRGMSERYENRPDIIEIIKNDDHFKESSFITGHFSYSVLALFDEYKFDVCTMLREPISRVISNIYQYTNHFPKEKIWKFGGNVVPKKGTNEYWSEIYKILNESETIRGLCPHENMMLRDGMVHMIGGTNLATYTKDAPLDKALSNAESVSFSIFEDYNNTARQMLESVGIYDVDFSQNSLGDGNPNKNAKHFNYGCPDNVISLIESMNKSDIIFYDTIVNNMK